MRGNRRKRCAAPRLSRPHAEEPHLCGRLPSPPELIRGSIILRKKFFRSGWIAGSSPAMTPAVLRIAPRANGSHVRVAVFIVNNKRKQRSGSDHTRRLVLHTTQQR